MQAAAGPDDESNRLCGIISSNLNMTPLNYDQNSTESVRSLRNATGQLRRVEICFRSSALDQPSDQPF